MAAHAHTIDQCKEETPQFMPANTSYDQANLLYRTFRWLGMQKPVAFIFYHLLPPLDRTVYRVTGGRYMAASVLAGLPMIELTTVGAKSGQLRTTPLLALQHGTSYVVIASSFGKPNHPAWYHNLCANPLVTVRRSQQSGTYAARVAEGDERARYWQLANQVYPGYNLYAQRASGRTIPVVVLDPIHDGVRG
jgi:deazaflavin-dependent oxidoreductase (nitroreductase family)